MTARRLPGPGTALLGLVVVAALTGCLGPTSGGSVVASPMEWTPEDAVDRAAVDDDRIADTVDRACATGEQASVRFDGSERGRVRAAYDDLRSGDGPLTVDCGDGAHAVRVELRLLT